LIGSFFWYIVREGFRSKKLMRELDEHEAQLEQRRVNLLNGLLGAFLGLAGHCVFMFPLHIVPSSVIGIFVIAMACAAARMPRKAFDLVGPKEKGALFDREDYYPFIISVFLLGGLIALPTLWSEPDRIDMTYKQALPWALGACLVFLAGFRTNGTISLIRTAPAVLAMAAVVWLFTKDSGIPVQALIAFAVFAIFALLICGYIGIGLGRVIKREMGT
ncbi:MAG: hypothetical protein JW941_12305, partial [Candidatus Coatesbacteria bacterium]|nr:hypothetical protein [Candidatus Coatesbacteria bacterium]